MVSLDNMKYFLIIILYLAFCFYLGYLWWAYGWCDNQCQLAYEENDMVTHIRTQEESQRYVDYLRDKQTIKKLLQQ